MKGPYTYKPVKFFLIAILATWAAWFLAAYFSYRQGSVAKGAFSIFELAGLFGPFCAALWMFAASGSSDLRQDFCGRLLNFKLSHTSIF